MILVDAGPLVALFDADDQHHERCRRILKTLDEKLITTSPVLTEALHLLRPGSAGPPRLMDYILHGGLTVFPLGTDLLRRCFDLMLQYADIPMDLADASIVCAAEHTRTEKVFTVDRRDFTTYRIRRGYHQVPFKIVGDPSGPQLVREGVAETTVAPADTPLVEEICEPGRCDPSQKGQNTGTTSMTTANTTAVRGSPTRR